MPSEPSGWVQDWVRRFVQTESDDDRLDSWVERTCGRIMAELPELGSRDGLAEQIGEAIREHWLNFLIQLPQPALSFRLVASAERISRESAQTSLPLETLNRIYRIAQQGTWEYTTELISAVDDSRPERTELLIYLWERASDWIDRSINETSRVYHEARRHIDVGRNALWLETVSRVLDGNLLEGRRVSAELGGYPIADHHTALIVTTSEQRQTMEDLEDACRHLAADLGLRQPLVVRPGGRQLWIWAATRRPMPLDPGFTPSEGPAQGMRIAIGASKPGLVGFASSHWQARRTLGVVHPDRKGVHQYDQMELLVLLGCDETVDDFIRRTLGDLGGALDHQVRLRHTVASYLAAGGSVDRAASQLSVHRNTIRYRLQQASALLGRDVGAMSSELTIALRHLDVTHGGQLP
ncbi:hypothetical protein GCM10027270_33900 [Nocardioides ginkgobilobae]